MSSERTVQGDGACSVGSGPEWAGDGHLPCRTAVRVLVVEDSESQRARLVQYLQADGRFMVVGALGSALEARTAIRASAPDVMTLDIDLPGMDGIEFLRRVMRLRPMPVVILSGLSGRESCLVTTALSLGAVACLDKCQARFRPGPSGFADQLMEAARTKPNAGFAFAARAGQPAAPKRRWNGRIVLIGASTGGVQALERLLPALGGDGPPVLISQHMPEPFLERLAARLYGQGGMRVSLARHGIRLAPGHAYIAPGGQTHLGVAVSALGGASLTLTRDVAGPCPSVAHLFASAMPMAPRILAVMLSGMGRDGADAMLALRRAGACCLSQDAASSVVFGMPSAALRLGAAECEVPLSQMADKILALTTEVMPL